MEAIHAWHVQIGDNGAQRGCVLRHENHGVPAVAGVQWVEIQFLQNQMRHLSHVDLIIDEKNGFTPSVKIRLRFGNLFRIAADSVGGQIDGESTGLRACLKNHFQGGTVFVGGWGASWQDAKL
jgi:hypothetical protein